MARLSAQAALVLAVSPLFTSEVAAQKRNVVDAQTAEVVAWWAVGDSVAYDVERTKVGRRSSAIQYALGLKVLDATDSTYLVECLYGDPVVKSELPDDPKARAAMEKVMTAFKGMRVVVRTDEVGMVEALVNPEEVATHTQAILDEVLAMSTDAEERERMSAAFSKLLTPELLSQSALEDMQYILWPFGVRYTLNETISAEVELPNMLGGAPVPGTLEMTMVRLDTTAATANIRAEQKIDPGALSKTLESLISELSETPMGKKDRKELRKMFEEMTVNDTLVMDVALEGAWCTKMSARREVHVMDEASIEERSYTLR